MAEKMIDQLVADYEQLIADCALMGSIFYMVLRMTEDVGERWEHIMTQLALVLLLLNRLILVSLEVGRK